jgi:hypothetical protein
VAVVVGILVFLMSLFQPQPLLAKDVVWSASNSRQLVQPEVLITAGELTPNEAARALMSSPDHPQVILRSHESLWLRFHVVADVLEPQQLYARYEVPWVDDARFYVLNERAEIIAQTVGGDTIKGPRAERMPIVSFALHRNSRYTVLLDVRTVPRAPVSIQLYSEAALTTRVFFELLTQGLFTGLALMLFIFHTNFYLATRDNLLLRYLAYLTTISIFLLIRTGLIPQQLFGRYAALSDKIWVLLVSACYASGVSFARSFLILKETMPSVDRVAKVMQYLCFLPVVAFAVSKPASLLIVNLMGLLVGPPLLVVGLIHFLRKRGFSLLFVIGYSLPIAAAIMDNLIENGLMASLSWRLELLPLAVTIEFLLFALVIYRKITGMAAARERDKAQLDKLRAEMAYARHLQRQLLPDLEQQFHHIAVTAAYEPENEVGGDYLDFVTPADGFVGVFLAHVDGSGLAAALDASAVRMAFRNSYLGELRPEKVLWQTNSYLLSHMGEREVAASYAVIRTETGECIASNGGNPPVYIVRQNLDVENSGERSKKLGQRKALEQLTHETISLKPGDCLLLATEGLARRFHRGPQGILAEQLRACFDGALTASECLSKLIAAARAPGSGKVGDIAAILVSYSKPGAGP